MGRKKTARVGDIHTPIYSKPVRRLSDNRVFSCARGAALNYDEKTFRGQSIAKLIIYCCHGYIRDVMGERWEFAEEIAVKKFESGSKVAVAKRKSRSQKAVRKDWRKQVLRTGPVLRNFVSERIDLHRRMMYPTEIYQEFSEYFEKASGEPLGYGLKQFAKHLKTWKELYHAVIGMRLTFDVVKERKKRVVQIGFYPEDVDGMTSFYDERYEVYDRIIPRYANAGKPLPYKPGRTVRPVKYIDQNITYSSLRAASIATMINVNLIKYNCEGDIPYVKIRNRIFHFEYGRLEDVTELPEQKQNWVYKSSAPKPVLCLDNYEVYRSIREASRETGVSIHNIIRSCNKEVSKAPPGYQSEDIIDWNCGTMGVLSNSGELLRFEFYSEDGI